MTLSLYDLLSKDLSDVAYIGKAVVASEEATLLMLHTYEKKGMLSQLMYIDFEEFAPYMEKKILANPSFLQTKGHYQYYMQLGNRSKLEQHDPSSVHYCVLDLFIEPGKPPIALLADHYFGHQRIPGLTKSPFLECVKKFGMQLVVLGEAAFQMDAKHCYIFCLDHLLLTASDTKLLTIINENITPGDSISEDLDSAHTTPPNIMIQADEVSSDDKGIDSYEVSTSSSSRSEEFDALESNPIIEMSWASLPPRYLLNAQTVKDTLFPYMDMVIEREGIGDKISAKEGSLAEDGFDVHLQKTLHTVTDEDEDGTYLKLRNFSVKYSAAKHAGEASLALYNIPLDELIQICYHEKYPLVEQILISSLAIQRKEGVDDLTGDNAHPLFAFAFSHAHIIENFLHNKDFFAIFSDPLLIFLMQEIQIAPSELLKAITYEKDGKLTLNSELCRNMLSNLVELKTITSDVLFDKTNYNPKFLTAILTNQSKTSNLAVNAGTKSFEKKLSDEDLIAALAKQELIKSSLLQIKPKEVNPQSDQKSGPN